MHKALIIQDPRDWEKIQGLVPGQPLDLPLAGESLGNYYRKALAARGIREIRYVSAEAWPDGNTARELSDPSPELPDWTWIPQSGPVKLPHILMEQRYFWERDPVLVIRSGVLPLDRADSAFPLPRNPGLRILEIRQGQAQPLEQDQQWDNILSPGAYFRVCMELLALSGREQFLGQGARVHPRARLLGHNIIGQGCHVGPGCVLEDCLLMPGVRIRGGTELKERILSPSHVVHPWNGRWTDLRATGILD